MQTRSEPSNYCQSNTRAQTPHILLPISELTSVLASQCNHAFVILQRTQLQELAVCESGGQEQMETKHFEAHLHADSVSPSTALGHPLLSLAQPAVGHSHNPVSSHATVYAAQCGSLSIIKEAHGSAQKTSNRKKRKEGLHLSASVS